MIVARSIFSQLNLTCLLMITKFKKTSAVVYRRIRVRESRLEECDIFQYGRPVSMVVIGFVNECIRIFFVVKFDYLLFKMYSASSSMQVEIWIFELV